MLQYTIRDHKYQRFGDEEIYSQIVRVIEVCDQNGDRVLLEQQKLLYLQSHRSKKFLVKYENMGICLFIMAKEHQ